MSPKAENQPVANYITYAVHKHCGGSIRACISVTGTRHRISFMCTKCHAIWDDPLGVIEIAVPDDWVEKREVGND